MQSYGKIKLAQNLTYLHEKPEIASTKEAAQLIKNNPIV